MTTTVAWLHYISYKCFSVYIDSLLARQQELISSHRSCWIKLQIARPRKFSILSWQQLKNNSTKRLKNRKKRSNKLKEKTHIVPTKIRAMIIRRKQEVQFSKSKKLTKITLLPTGNSCKHYDHLRAICPHIRLYCQGLSISRMSFSLSL